MGLCMGRPYLRQLSGRVVYGIVALVFVDTDDVIGTCGDVISTCGDVIDARDDVVGW